jgi:hypothetical protein
MIVAIRALESSAEEHLTDQLGLCACVHVRAREVGWPHDMAIANRGHQSASHFVQWNALADLLAHPAVKGDCSLLVIRQWLNAKQNREAVGPVLDEIATL